MRFTFDHSTQFKDGTATIPYRSTRWWKTERGALRAAEQHAKGMEKFYVEGTVAVHALRVWDDQGRFITSMLLFAALVDFLRGFGDDAYGILLRLGDYEKA